VTQQIERHGGSAWRTCRELAGKQWTINFRVCDLEAMMAQLKAAGIAVEPGPDPYPNGRFACLYDPEGNPIELSEPAGRHARQP